MLKCCPLLYSLTVGTEAETDWSNGFSASLYSVFMIRIHTVMSDGLVGKFAKGVNVNDG